MTTVTLCTIARNEEANILACLESARGCVDKMVVVDTGSTDNTAAIARDAGAVVVTHLWQDDFSAARNAALDQVSDGFVLVLDADEQLGPGACDAIREAVQHENIDGARLPLHNASAIDASHQDVLTGTASIGPPTLLERLLRKTDDLKWQGIVHEHVTEWYEKGRTIITIDAPIIHYGAVPELRIKLGKNTRNLHLLEKMCEQQSNNATYLTYFAQELMNNQQFERAGEVISTAWNIIDRYPVTPQKYPVAVPAATVHIGFLLNAENYAAAYNVLARALELAGEHPNLHLLTATVLQSVWQSMPDDQKDNSLLDLAISECQACFRYSGQPLNAPSIPGADSWVPSARMGTVRLLQGEYPLAKADFDKVLENCPGHVEAMLGKAEALIFCGRPDTAMHELIPLLHPQIADGWILAALAGYQFSEYDEIAPMLLEGRKATDQHGLMCSHRLPILTTLESIGDQCQAA